MPDKERIRRQAPWQSPIILVAFGLTLLWFNWQVLWPAAAAPTHGFGAYYSASRLLAQGTLSADIYDPAYFRPIVQADSQGQIDDIYNANPPTTTLMLWPLSFLPIDQARLVWTLLNIVFLIGGVALLLLGFGLPLSERRQWPVWLLVLGFGLLFQPIIHNVTFGQAYLLVFFLLSIATAAFFKNQPTGGIALALALLLKTAGWPLLILLFWLRKGRYLAWLLSSAIVVFLATLPIFPLEMWLTYGRLLSHVGRSPLICAPAYQTTRSWLCHLLAPGVDWQEAQAAGIPIPTPVTIIYFSLGAVCLFVLLRLAQKRPNPALLGLISWSVLFLPLGEVHHHTVMLIPFVWFIVRWPEQSRFSRAIIVLAAVCYLIPFPINAPQFQSGWQALLAYPYLAGAWLIFLGILWDHKLEMLPPSAQQQ
jgi:hypothetical protein